MSQVKKKSELKPKGRKVGASLTNGMSFTGKAKQRQKMTKGHNKFQK